MSTTLSEDRDVERLVGLLRECSVTGTAAAGEHFEAPSILHAQVLDLLVNFLRTGSTAGALMHGRPAAGRPCVCTNASRSAPASSGDRPMPRPSCAGPVSSTSMSPSAWGPTSRSASSVAGLA